MKVTIGLPVYNTRPFLADALRSIFAQTHRDWELIAVDDGSTDGSIEIVEAVKDPRVRVIRGDVRLGLPARLNQMVDLARGEYFVRMDSDDMMYPERIERQLAHLRENPSIDLLGTGTYAIDLENKPVGARGLAPRVMTPRLVLDHGPMIHATAVGKLAWFRANRYDNFRRRGQDRELFCRVHRHTVFAHIPEPLYLVRELGTVTLGKYVAVCAVQRRLLRQYGREMAGTSGMLALMLKTTLKELIYRICFLTHTERYVIKRRNKPLTETQRREFDDVVRRIASTRVPGLDDKVEGDHLCLQAS